VANYEVSKVYELIVSSKTLSRRKNIGFHLAYQEGDYYPINHLRNIALNNVISPFVFLLDNDFDNDADSKDTRLTIMEEVLLLGLKDKEVTNIIQSIDSLNESNAKKNVVVL